jgi:hypothetical protein
MAECDRISDHDRQRLLQLARHALDARVQRRPAPPIERGGAVVRARGALGSID